MDAHAARCEMDALREDSTTVDQLKESYNNYEPISRPKAEKFANRKVKFRQKQFEARKFNDDELNVTIKEMLEKGHGIIMGSRTTLPHVQEIA